MKQAIYLPNPGAKRGRPWTIKVLGNVLPEVGETVEVIKKHSGGKDVVTIATVTPDFICTFTHRIKMDSPQVAPPQSVDVSQFLDVPQDTPETLQNAPQSIQKENSSMDQSQVPQNAQIDLASAIAGAVAATANQAAQALEARITKALEEVREQVKDIQARPTHTSIQIAELPPVALEGHQHPLFEKVLRLANAGINILLVGEAGCGKTYLSQQVAKALGKVHYGTVHCTAGMSESHVSGWLLPIGEGGKFEYRPAEFVRMWQEGNGLFLFDEIDAADPNVLMFLNGALANGTLHIPHRLEGSEVKRGENFVMMAAANTFGHGANARYAGRNQLDGATLDRFYVVQMDYDAMLEASIYGGRAVEKRWTPAPEPTDYEIRELGEWVVTLRNNVHKTGLRRIVSTRTIQKAILARRAGLSTKEIKEDTLAGWTADERAKVGV